MTQLRNHDSDFIYMHIDISLLSQICQKGTLTQNELNNYTTCNQWIDHRDGSRRVVPVNARLAQPANIRGRGRAAADVGSSGRPKGMNDTMVGPDITLSLISC